MEVVPVATRGSDKQGDGFHESGLGPNTSHARVCNASSLCIYNFVNLKTV